MATATNPHDFVEQSKQRTAEQRRREREQVAAGVASELDLVLRGLPHSASVLQYATGELAGLRDVLLAAEPGGARHMAALRWLDDAGDELDARYTAYQLVMDSRDARREAIRRERQFFRKTAANAALVAGQTVRMVKDVSETDRYGRLLRYVYVGDTFVNGALVAGGWAQAVDYPPDTAMSGLLHSLTAQGAGRGCALVAAPLPTEPVRAPDPIPVGNCDPSYPTVCIPPPPPDLDCGDIPYRRFQVLPPDPHRFDGNNDGVGCESG